MLLGVAGLILALISIPNIAGGPEVLVAGGVAFPPPISPRGFVRARGRFHGRKKGVMGAGRLPELILERVRQRYKCLNMHSAFGRAEHNSQHLAPMQNLDAAMMIDCFVFVALVWFYLSSP